MKIRGATHKIFRDPSPQLVFRPNSERRAPAGSRAGYDPKVKFKFREVKPGRGPRPLVMGGSPDETIIKAPPADLPKRKDWVAGEGLGLLAMLTVVHLWAAVGADLVNRLGDFEWWWVNSWMGTAFSIALYGCHLLGIAGCHLSPANRPLGLVAIVAFWLGLLGQVVAGLVLMFFLG